MFVKRAARFLPVLALVAILALVAGAVAAQTDEASPFLGMSIADDPSGVLVVDVLPDGPAAAAGLQADDIITAVDGETATADQLTMLLSEYSIGDEVTLDVLRGEETIAVTVTLADRADFTLPEATPQVAEPDAEMTPDASQPVPPVPPAARPFLGVGLEDSDDGVAIVEVVEGSPAAAAGLEAGDIVTAVNGTEITSAQALVDAIGALAPNDTITLDTTRDGEAMTSEITLAVNPNPVMGMPGRGPRDNRGPRGNGMPFEFNMRGMDVILYDAANESWQVVALSEDGALYEAGLRSGDVITAIDNEAISPEDLSAYLEGLDADADVTLSIERDGAAQDIVIPASALDEVMIPGMGMRGLRGMEGMPFGFGMPMMGGSARLGVSIVDLNEETAAENNVDVTEGALVLEVVADTPAEAAGLQAGDIITAVDGDVVDAERTLRDRLYAYEPEDTVTLSVLRDGETLEVDATLDAAPVGFHMMPFAEGRGPMGRDDSNEMSVPADSPSA